MLFRRGRIFGFGILSDDWGEFDDEWEEFDEMMKEELLEMLDKLVVAEYVFDENDCT